MSHIIPDPIDFSEEHNYLKLALNIQNFVFSGKYHF